MKISLDAFGQYLDRPGFRETGRALHEQVAIAEQRDQHSVYQV
jgi:hypothetical protein